MLAESYANKVLSLRYIPKFLKFFMLRFYIWNMAEDGLVDRLIQGNEEIYSFPDGSSLVISEEGIVSVHC